MDDESLYMTNLLQDAFEEAKRLCPLDEDSKYFEITPRLRVPTDDWDGYGLLVEAFDLEGEPMKLRRKMRQALVLTMRAMEEHLSGGDPNWVGLERILRRRIVFQEMDSDEEPEEPQEPIIFDHKRRKPGNTMHYKVLDQGKEMWLGKYQLKKKYPETYENMLQAYKEKNLDQGNEAKEAAKDDGEERTTSIAQGSEEGKRVQEEEEEENRQETAKLPRKEEDIHQGSTIVGSTDEKKAAMDMNAVKGQQAEGHGEGGGIPDEVKDVPNKKPFHGVEKRRADTMEKVDEVLPTPPTQKIYSQRLEATIPYQGGHAGMKKRPSEPAVHHKSSPDFDLGRGLLQKKVSSSKHAGLLEPKSAPPPKRTRFSVGDNAYAGGPERPYISSSRTDTASVAMELLSKVISNEKMLCEALEEEQARNQYLQEILREKGPDRQEEEEERIMYQVDQMVASQLQKTTASLEEYRSKYETEKKNLSQSQEEKSLLAAEIESLKNQLTDTQTERDKALLESEKTAKKIESLTNSTKKLETSLQKQRESNQKHFEEGKKKAQELKNLFSKTITLEDNLKKQEEAKKKYSAQLEKKTLEIDSLQSRIKEMKEAIEQNTKENKEKSYGLRSSLAQLKSIFTADPQEAKKLTQQLSKAVETQEGDIQTVVQFILALKQGADEAMKQYQTALSGTADEIKSLREQVERFKAVEKERQEKGGDAVQKALEMQAKAREFLSMIKSGKRYTYEEPHISESDEDVELAGVTDPAERKRLSMLKPYYWREQNDASMKPRIHIATTRNSKVVLTIIFPEKECRYLYDSEELHAKQNCLLPLLKFYESRVTSRKDKK
eukprot:CAMPEP_0118808898 /NCGR_PEP_ID=MMETSP1161-20130426/36215_1 /TAXON_ID=249345 /ORGANISM="Picochlorum oklahomensis, Strain CCMP2329" /LENGTH=832 /DNA_ID=CAMNT_0006738293 /DNA_START=89 /DNA_END=2587 /DNA_ORIENTATION=+